MPQIEQVMTASEFSPEKHLLLLPLYATPKIDGVRFYIKNGSTWTRANKPLPNKCLRLLLPVIFPDGTDGELCGALPNDPEAFQKAQSIAMGVYAAIEAVQLYVFDYLKADDRIPAPYNKRIMDFSNWWATRTATTLADQFIRPAEDSGVKIKSINQLCAELNVSTPKLLALIELLRSRVTVLTPTALRKPHHPEKFLQSCLDRGYEGIMLRLPYGGYKFGRSTQDEALLLKYKPWADDEAEVIGFEELMHNDNEASISPTGKTVRSSSAAGKRPGATLGKFLVRDRRSGLEFAIGGGQGLTQAFRQQVWNNRESFLSLTIKYRYLKVGTKEGGSPRMPQFIGFRDKRDL